MPGTPRTPRNKGGEGGKKPPTPRTSSPLPSMSGSLSNTPVRPGTGGPGNVPAQSRASPTPRTLGQCVDAYLSQMDPNNGAAVLDRLMRDFDPQYNLFSQQLNLRPNPSVSQEGSAPPRSAWTEREEGELADLLEQTPIVQAAKAEFPGQSTSPTSLNKKSPGKPATKSRRTVTIHGRTSGEGSSQPSCVPQRKRSGLVVSNEKPHSSRNTVRPGSDIGQVKTELNASPEYANYNPFRRRETAPTSQSPERNRVTTAESNNEILSPVLNVGVRSRLGTRTSSRKLNGSPSLGYRFQVQNRKNKRPRDEGECQSPHYRQHCSRDDSGTSSSEATRHSERPLRNQAQKRGFNRGERDSGQEMNKFGHRNALAVPRWQVGSCAKSPPRDTYRRRSVDASSPTNGQSARTWRRGRSTRSRSRSPGRRRSPTARRVRRDEMPHLRSARDVSTSVSGRTHQGFHYSKRGHKTEIKIANVDQGDSTVRVNNVNDATWSCTRQGGKSCHGCPFQTDQCPPARVANITQSATKIQELPPPEHGEGADLTRGLLDIHSAATLLQHPLIVREVTTPTHVVRTCLSAFNLESAGGQTTRTSLTFQIPVATNNEAYDTQTASDLANAVIPAINALLYRVHGQIARLEHFNSVQTPRWLRTRLNNNSCPYQTSTNGSGSRLTSGTSNIPRSSNSYGSYGRHIETECESTYCLSVCRINKVVHEMRIHVCGQHHSYGIDSDLKRHHTESVAYLRRSRHLLEQLFTASNMSNPSAYFSTSLVDNPISLAVSILYHCITCIPWAVFNGQDRPVCVDLMLEFNDVVRSFPRWPNSDFWPQVTISGQAFTLKNLQPRVCASSYRFGRNAVHIVAHQESHATWVLPYLSDFTGGHLQSVDFFAMYSTDLSPRNGLARCEALLSTLSDHCRDHYGHNYPYCYEDTVYRISTTGHRFQLLLFGGRRGRPDALDYALSYPHGSRDLYVDRNPTAVSPPMRSQPRHARRFNSGSHIRCSKLPMIKWPYKLRDFMGGFNEAYFDGRVSRTRSMSAPSIFIERDRPVPHEIVQTLPNGTQIVPSPVSAQGQQMMLGSLASILIGATMGLHNYSELDMYYGRYGDESYLSFGMPDASFMRLSGFATATQRFLDNLVSQLGREHNERYYLRYIVFVGHRDSNSIFTVQRAISCLVVNAEPPYTRFVYSRAPPKKRKELKK